MKVFLETNNITYNLMSFTAFKSIFIFSLLLDGPKSYDEINEFVQNNEYIRETISNDSLRIYLNTLKYFGCEISKKRVNKVLKYYITSHPFMLKINKKQAASIIKIYKALLKSTDVEDLISLQQFFSKISQFVADEEFKKRLQNLSPMTDIDPELIKKLMSYTENNAEITILYNSPNSGSKKITIALDRMYISNKKLYIAGYNSEKKNYSGFLVNKIRSIIEVNLLKKTITMPEITVGYEYIKDPCEKFEPIEGEKIIKNGRKKILVEMKSKNKFEIMQRVMYHSTRCKVLYPEDFKNYIITGLKKIKEEYIERQ